MDLDKSTDQCLPRNDDIKKCGTVCSTVCFRALSGASYLVQVLRHYPLWYKYKMVYK